MRTKVKTSACVECGETIDLTGRVGRPPFYCGIDCRRTGRAAEERHRRTQRSAEIDRLREIVARYEAIAA